MRYEWPGLIEDAERIVLLLSGVVADDPAFISAVPAHCCCCLLGSSTSFDDSRANVPKYVLAARAYPPKIRYSRWLSCRNARDESVRVFLIIVHLYVLVTENQD